MWQFLASIVIGLINIIFVRTKPEEHHVIVVEPAKGTERGDARRLVDAYIAELQYRSPRSDGGDSCATWDTSADPKADTVRLSNPRK